MRSTKPVSKVLKRYCAAQVTLLLRGDGEHTQKQRTFKVPMERTANERYYVLAARMHIYEFSLQIELTAHSLFKKRTRCIK